MIEEPIHELTGENKCLGIIMSHLTSSNDMQEYKIKYLTELVERMQKKLSKFKAQL